MMFDSLLIARNEFRGDHEELQNQHRSLWWDMSSIPTQYRQVGQTVKETQESHPTSGA